jgi:hypothetical protein
VLSGPPANISENTNLPSGKVVNYAKPTATDNIDGPLGVSCTLEPGSTFPVGHTTVTCTATDAHGNSESVSFSVDIALVDSTPPVLSGVPGNISGTTDVPGGKVVNFPSPSASDNVDGPLPATCDRTSGSNFVVGTTTVTCSATDAHGNQGQAAFTVTITLVDTTAPVLSNVSADIAKEANGPTGSIVGFTNPTAIDNLDGPLAGVGCLPVSGSTFALGLTTVTCSATDLHGNTGSASFDVTVADTTPPALVIPNSFGIHASTPEGIARTHPTISGFLASASASDIVDPNPTVANNAPAFLPVGTTDVTFTAQDASGNATSRSSSIVVLPQPPPGTPPLPVPPPPKQPDNPKSLKATPGNGAVKLVWAPVPGAKQYLVYRSESGQRRTTAAGHGQLIYSGRATTFTDRGLRNGVEYRYVVVVEDAAGNQSAGVVIAVVPRKNLLRKPANGARLKKIPKEFVWQRDPRATYYNLQLYLGGALLFQSTAADPTKILSVFPTKPLYRLKSPWRWEGRRYKMKKGLYTWYVWPGYGARADVNYGPLLGSATFRLTK